LEKSRELLETHGIRIAAISYDSRETLASFAEKNAIRFPLLSDRDSTVIRRFSIFNTNIAPGLRSYGVPHPVEYLVAPDGMVVRKYFVPNYQNRVTGAAVALKEFGTVAGGSQSVTLRSGAVSIEIGLSSPTAFAGQEIGFFATFQIEPDWHVYETTSVTFDDPKVASQSFQLPSLATYAGKFKSAGSLLLKFPLPEGPITLSGHVQFQQCGETICEPPETLPFEIGITLERFLIAVPNK
jgi:hypothetical protein